MALFYATGIQFQRRTPAVFCLCFYSHRHGRWPWLAAFCLRSTLSLHFKYGCKIHPGQGRVQTNLIKNRTPEQRTVVWYQGLHYKTHQSLSTHFAGHLSDLISFDFMGTEWIELELSRVWCGKLLLELGEGLGCGAENRARYWVVLQNKCRQTGTRPDMQKGWFMLLCLSFVQECLTVSFSQRWLNHITLWELGTPTVLWEYACCRQLSAEFHCFLLL